MPQVVCSFCFHYIFAVYILGSKLKIQHTLRIDYRCAKRGEFLKIHSLDVQCTCNYKLVLPAISLARGQLDKLKLTGRSQRHDINQPF